MYQNHDQMSTDCHLSFMGSTDSHPLTANNFTFCFCEQWRQFFINPLMLTAAIWAQLWSILCQTRLSRHLWFLTSGHSDTQGWASECSDVKNYKWRLNPVWHKTLYSCTHMATVGVKGLSDVSSKLVQTSDTGVGWAWWWDEEIYTLIRMEILWRRNGEF